MSIDKNKCQKTFESIQKKTLYDYTWLEKEWILFKNKTLLPYFTSDNPVILWKAGDKHIRSKTEFKWIASKHKFLPQSFNISLERGIMYFVTLNPYTLLLLSEDNPFQTSIIEQRKVSQIFNTYISGNVQNVATGSSNTSQIGRIELKHNKEALAELLQEKGIPPTDIENLLTAIEDDRKVDPDQKNVGPKVTNWLGSMLKKSASGAWKIGSGVATAVLTKAITAYYGLE